MRLDDFLLKDGLEEIVTWGILPLKELVSIMDEELEVVKDEPLNHERLLFLMYELRNKLEDVEKTLYRFEDERHSALT